nr:putative ribonuclease H-like domain-containing protein [Tanacetum cinerariifolium]
MNYQPVTAGNQSNPSAGVQEQFDAEKAGKENVQQYVLFSLWSSGSKDPHNTDGNPNFEVKEPVFEVEKPESEVHVSLSSSAKTKKHDDKTKREAKGKTLEDITYSDDEEDVGKEADFTNLETTITVSPIPITRVHKDHLVTQIIGDLSSATQTRRHTQEEGIDYEEFFAPVARIEAIRLFLAYASFMGFMVYQMDVKSAFLYETIDEEVYVCQPSGFEDPDYPNNVYKVVKALYRLHQVPRAWYETLANYLLDNGFQRGKIDRTLFIKKKKGDILLVHVYVDDIIFGSTNKDLCKAFKKLMKDKFQMSSMGELTFFLDIQVKQKPDEIFINHDKYVAEILRKFGLTDRKSASTPRDTEKPLLKDLNGEDMDVQTYRSMIGSLMYLTSSRLDIMFVVCVYAHFQVTPKASHLHAVKRIFRYLKGKPHLGLWYPKDSPFNLVAYSDSDYAGASLDRKSTIGGCQFLRCRLISWQCRKQIIVATSSTEAEYVAAVNDVVRLQALIDRKKVIITKDIVREALRLDDAESIDCLPNEGIFTELERMGAQVGDLSSHTIKYSSLARTQKVFANMRRVGKGFSGVDTPLFEGMLVQQQDADDTTNIVADDVDDVVAEDVAEPTLPSPIPTTTPPPPQELPSTSQVAPTPPPSPIAQPSSPPQQQQHSQPTTISLDLLNSLLETCTVTPDNFWIFK